MPNLETRIHYAVDELTGLGKRPVEVQSDLPLKS